MCVCCLFNSTITSIQTLATSSLMNLFCSTAVTTTLTHTTKKKKKKKKEKRKVAQPTCVSSDSAANVQEVSETDINSAENSRQRHRRTERGAQIGFRFPRYSQGNEPRQHTLCCFRHRQPGMRGWEGGRVVVDTERVRCSWCRDTLHSPTIWFSISVKILDFVNRCTRVFFLLLRSISRAQTLSPHAAMDWTSGRRSFAIPTELYTKCIAQRPFPTACCWPVAARGNSPGGCGRPRPSVLLLCNRRVQCP